MILGVVADDFTGAADRPDAHAADLPAVGGFGAVVSGSCPQATDAQVRRWIDDGGAAFKVDARVLGVQRPRIGAAIDPGVPWTQAEGRPLLLALKSGNFGRIDCFSHALSRVA